MIQIHLEQLQFYAYHGLYQEERSLGNEYIVDIHIDYQPKQKIIYSIEETIDYSKVYELIAKRMKVPSDLLETIATEFCFQLMEKFSSVQGVQFRIKKMHPPIKQFIGNVGVSFQLKRSDL
jgi:dihydroneopterin aldolase